MVGFKLKKVVAHSTVIEDNKGYLELTNLPKMQPRTSAIKYHHFRKHVNKSLFIHSINTNEQIADALTKPLEQSKFEYLRKKLCGW